MASSISIKSPEGPAGGWGNLKGLGKTLLTEFVPATGATTLLHQNKPDGFACVSCAWAKPEHPHLLEFCENGGKATAWELTKKRVTREFFARHTVTELLAWGDHELEDEGRLTEPMRYDAATDRYVPVAWSEAFAEIGRELKTFEPESVVFYASGRASLETSYMWSLLARMYGNNNLPDSSNMCHESTSVALPESIGVPVGTVTLDDFDQAHCLMFFGQNIGTNSPRMLTPVHLAAKRGVPIITFNPLREAGLEGFRNPQSPTEMLTGAYTPISSQYHQVKAAGDIAAIAGMCKALLALDDRAQREGTARVLDIAFIERHTHGFDAFASAMRDLSWEHVVARSGLTREALEAAAAVYARAPATIGIYGMGLTQHRHGVENVQMLVNLLLMRGNIGRPGAGICPVRGHSNVQGQRTVGITEKPELVPVEKLEEFYGFKVPTRKGLNTIEACEGIVAGSVRAFMSLGGNFVRAVPDTQRMEAAWKDLRLSVQISTKLNRSHLIHGEISYILPCIGRIEIDEQASGPQAVSVESSTANIHGSRGRVKPASEQLLSEPRIVAELAKATLEPNPKVDWDAWVADYSLVRTAIERTYPDQFADFNGRMFQPGGFHRPIAARERQWKTKTGKANFVVPKSLDEPDERPDDVLQLMTLRSNDQFNTTVYSYDDRYRGVWGTRMVLFMNVADIERLGLRDGETVGLAGVWNDGVERTVQGLRITLHDIPPGCCAGYYPELNPLIPLAHHAEGSKVPAAKSVPVRVVRQSHALVKLGEGVDPVEQAKAGEMVGATGIEPVTTTMSTQKFPKDSKD